MLLARRVGAAHHRSGDVSAVADGDPAGVPEDPGVRGAAGGLRGGAVAGAAAVHVVRAHVPRVGRHPAVHAGVRRRPAGQAGQQRQEREDAADLLQLVLHGAGPLHRVRGHRHRLHPAGQGLGRRLLRAVVLMVTALTLFLLGSPFYLKAAADRSAILGLVQVLVASYKNRHEPMPPIKLLHFCISSTGRWKNSLDALIKSSIKEVSISWLST